MGQAPETSGEREVFIQHGELLNMETLARRKVYRHGYGLMLAETSYVKNR